MEGPDPRIADHYADLAEHWAWITDSPTRERLLWAALEDMLPALDGARVLDAGCGSGVYAERLLERGADVVGVDVSGAMVEAARDLVPDGTFRQADLAEPLEFLADGSVDVVLCQHVFSHLREIGPPISEFARVLRPGGVLVVSTHNPVQDYVVVREERHPAVGEQADLDPTVHTGDGQPRYTETERFDVTWGSGAVANRGTYYRRPIEALLSPLLSAGFDLDAVAEPAPDEDFEREHPELSEQLREFPPASLCLRATLTER